METAQIVAFIAFVLLAAVVAAGTRRAGVALRRTRVAEGFRGALTDLARRVERSLNEISVLIDAVRRREADPEALPASLTASIEAVERYAAEARALSVPPGAAVHREAIVAELERAARALDHVLHGCALVTRGRNEQGSEADTAIKRGYLNLIHARESLATHAAAAIAAAERASPVRRYRRPRP